MRNGFSFLVGLNSAQAQAHEVGINVQPSGDDQASVKGWYERSYKFRYYTRIDRHEAYVDCNKLMSEKSRAGVQILVHCEKRGFASWSYYHLVTWEQD